MDVVIYCGMVHWGRRCSHHPPQEQMRVAVRMHWHLVLPPAPLAIASRRHTSELSDVGSSPRRLLSRAALLVHVHVIFAREVFCRVEVRVGVQLDVEPASIKEHHVGVRLELVHLARGGVARLVGAFSDHHRAGVPRDFPRVLANKVVVSGPFVVRFLGGKHEGGHEAPPMLS